MPSPEATALTLAHRREVGLVAAVASRQVAAIARTAEPVDIDAWWDRVAGQTLRVVAGTASVAARLGARYLLRHAGLEGVRIRPVQATPNVDEIATSLRVMGPVAFKTHLRLSGSIEASVRTMVEQLSGASASRAFDGSRGSVMDTFAADDRMVGWRRVLTSANPCAFCAMLASRGAVYSKDTVDFQAHKPRCFCVPEPLYRREPEPDDVLALREQWEDSTAGFGGRDALNAFRRARSA